MDPHHIHQHQYGGGGVYADYAATGGVSGGGGDSSRFPQWSIEEAREFLAIRGELDAAFMESKRNRPLWEVIATRMREKGYNRTSEQCKCKWKNLVTRYKGCETMEAESMRQQFPLYNEMQAIFAGRMQRMLWMETEGVGAASESYSKRKSATTEDIILSDDEIDEDYDEATEDDITKKRKRKKSSSRKEKNTVMNSVREILEGFMKKQKEIEMEWMKAYETREEERRRREIEWRQTSETLEKERLMMERRWREREGQRRVRDEAKAEKRDALFTALLQRLANEPDD